MKYTIGILLLAGLITAGCTTNGSGRGTSDPDSLPGDFPINDGSLGGGKHYPQNVNRDLFAPVFFDYDSALVKPEEIGKCEQVARYLKKHKAKGVIVEGHADERGSREYNLALGEVRALAVRDYLITLGVDADATLTKSYGEEKSANDGHDEKAWSQNRRVVFAIY